MNLYKWQSEVADTYPEKTYINAETGTGKTRAALHLASKHNYKNLLVIAPLSAQPSWRDESEIFPSLNIKVVSYEVFRDKVSEQEIQDYDFVIFDEAHRLKNPSAKLTKKAMILAKKQILPPRIMLSGTPMNKYHEIYSQLYILDPKDPIFDIYPSYSKFIKNLFTLDVYFKPKNPINNQVREMLKKWFDSYAYKVRREDVVDLPPYTINVIKFKERIEKMYNPNALAEFMKNYHQVALSKEKINFCLDFIEENKSSIIFTPSLKFIEIMREKLEDNAYYITGQDKKDLYNAIVKADKPIITTYSLKEGANLQQYKNVIFTTLPLSFTDYEQSRSRVYRSGQTEKVVEYRLLQDEVDYTVERIIRNKSSIYEYFRRA